MGAFVVEATLVLDHRVDPASVGAAVTAELCGHWEHSGACRFPHHNDVSEVDGRTVLRTVFVADADEESLLRRRVESALRAGSFWRVLGTGTDELRPAEQELAGRLTSGPRAAPPSPA